MDGRGIHCPAWFGTMSFPPPVSSPFPWSRQFLVEDRKKLLTEANILHIQDLFSVVVSCFSEQSGLDCMAVTVASVNGEEQVMRAEVSGRCGGSRTQNAMCSVLQTREHFCP